MKKVLLILAASLVMSAAAKAQSRIIFVDSLKNLDTAVINLPYTFAKGEPEVSNKNASADTVAIEIWDEIKNDWSLNVFGLMDMQSSMNETNNGVIIIPANTSRRWEIVGILPGKFRIRTLSNRTRTLIVGCIGAGNL